MSNIKTMVCLYCNNTINDWCKTCIDGFPNRKPSHQMSPDERVAEFFTLVNRMTIPLDLTYQRIRELLGRDFINIELSSSLLPKIVEEIRNNNSPSNSNSSLGTETI